MGLSYYQADEHLDDSNRQPIPLRQRIWHHFLVLIVFVIQFISACGSASAVFFAFGSIQRRHSENFDLLSLIFVSMPAALVQLLILIPLTWWLIRVIAARPRGLRLHWLLHTAIFSFVVTFLAVAIGLFAAI